MNFNYESQMKGNKMLLDIFCQHRNAVFSKEWTAIKAAQFVCCVCATTAVI